MQRFTLALLAYVLFSPTLHAGGGERDNDALPAKRARLASVAHEDAVTSNIARLLTERSLGLTPQSRAHALGTDAGFCCFLDARQKQCIGSCRLKQMVDEGANAG